jgi:2-polyprenyl-6-methoxyphenol hydroxylase-like FAD-dependent oxidoreductase
MPGRVNVAVAVPRALSPDAKADPADILSALREVVATHAPGAAAIDGLWAMQSPRPFLWPLLDMRAPDITALDGRLAFVGDSGIGFLPTAGVGASNALRSAAALAYDLSMADANSVPAALSRWRTRVKKLVEGNQHDSRQLARVMMVKHKTSSTLINTLMKYMPVTAMTKSIVASMAAPF